MIDNGVIPYSENRNYIQNDRPRNKVNIKIQKKINKEQRKQQRLKLSLAERNIKLNFGTGFLGFI